MKKYPEDKPDTPRFRNEEEQAALAALEEELVALAQQAAAGEKGTDEQLAALLDDLPESVRTEVVERFRALEEELDREPELEQELTPEQAQQKRLLEERERNMMISQWLSYQTLKKIRRALLMNPALFDHIKNIGEELNKKGVFFETRKVQLTNSELGGVSVQADLARNKDKEKDIGKER